MNDTINLNTTQTVCAICLEVVTCRNRCFSYSCMHQFCYGCLLEWSEIKSECPMCKTNITSILHNIRPNGRYDEYRSDRFSRPQEILDQTQGNPIVSQSIFNINTTYLDNSSDEDWNVDDNISGAEDTITALENPEISGIDSLSETESDISNEMRHSYEDTIESSATPGISDIDSVSEIENDESNVMRHIDESDEDDDDVEDHDVYDNIDEEIGWSSSFNENSSDDLQDYVGDVAIDSSASGSGDFDDYYDDNDDYYYDDD